MAFPDIIGPIALFTVGLYTLLAVLARRPRSGSEFVRPKLKFGALALSTLTIIGAGEIITFMSLTNFYGWNAALLFSGSVAGFVLLALVVAPRLRSIVGEQNSVYALPALVRAKLGPISEAVVLISSALALMCLLIIQIDVGSRVFAAVFDMGPFWVALFMLASAAAYIYLGGFQGVLAADVIDMILLVVALAVLALVLTFAMPTPLAASAPALAEIADKAIPLGSAVSLFAIGFCATVCGGDVWQRLLAADSGSAARRAMLFNAGMWLGLAVLLTGAALLAWRHPAAEYGTTTAGDAALIAVIADGLPTGASVIVATAIFMATLSTADLELFAVSTLLASARRAAPAAADDDAWLVERQRIRRTLGLVAAATLGAVVFLTNNQIVYWSSLMLFMVPLVSVAAVAFGRAGGWVDALQVLSLLVTLYFITSNIASEALEVDWRQAAVIAGLASLVAVAGRPRPGVMKAAGR